MIKVYLKLNKKTKNINPILVEALDFTFVERNSFFYKTSFTNKQKNRFKLYQLKQTFYYLHNTLKLKLRLIKIYIKLTVNSSKMV